MMSWPPPIETMIDDPAREQNTSGNDPAKETIPVGNTANIALDAQIARMELQERKGRPFHAPEHGTDVTRVAPGVWVAGKVGVTRISVTLAEAQEGVERFSVSVNTTDFESAKRIAVALSQIVDHPETG